MLCREEETSVYWIDSDTQLAKAVASWENQIGLDTEFIRTDTFYPLAGLYQVASGNDVFLLDPLVIESWQPLVDYLHNPDHLVVMHACQEDLELMFHHLGARPANIFDTQFANAFVSEDFSLSYANLARNLVQVDLEKQQTRSNWLKRPLSEEQLAYAVDDVTLLVPMFKIINERIAELGRSDWFARDMSLRGQYMEPQPSEYYRQVKRAWQLKPEQLSMLQALCQWRENAARQFDIPRNRVVWDDHLMTFAIAPALDNNVLQNTLPSQIAKRHGQALIACHRKAQANKPQASKPIEQLDKPLGPGASAKVKALREVAVAAAKKLAIAPELLARKKDVEACFRDYAKNNKLSEHYMGWRRILLEQEFLQILEPVNDN
ncbi:MAG: ribonuclease D [Pseudomonadales bacterium]|nr:ribonuclease D [Pseudomonadales bacterium]